MDFSLMRGETPTRSATEEARLPARAHRAIHGRGTGCKTLRGYGAPASRRAVPTLKKAVGRSGDRFGAEEENA
jgi:hypothetical protein